MKRIAVLLSNKGTGSNLQAILDAIDAGTIQNGKVIIVVSDAADAQGLDRAKKHKVPTLIFDWKPFLAQGHTREEYDAALGKRLQRYAPDLIILAGWMRILSQSFLDQYPDRVINLHPGLLPDPGHRDIELSTGERISAIRGLHTDAAVQYAIDHRFPATGSTVHFVTPVVDDGAVILRGEVRINPNDTVKTLYPRIKTIEHQILPQAIEMVCNGGAKP